MDISNIQHVLILAEELNFSRAAEKLHITQSTLSQEIKKLENEFGFPLFTRNTKKVELTDNGKEFILRAQQISDQMTYLQEWITSTHENESKKILFGASSITMPHVVNHIQEFTSQNPNVEFDYIEQWDPILLSMVDEGSLDMALTVIPQEKNKRKGVEYYPINEQYVCAVVSSKHKLYGHSSISLEDLDGEDLVMTSVNSGLSSFLIEKISEFGLMPHFLINTANMEARLSMVRNGAITFVLDKQFFIYDNKEFAIIPLEPKIKFTYTIVASSKKKFSSVERKFLEAIRNGLIKDYFL